MELCLNQNLLWWKVHCWIPDSSSLLSSSSLAGLVSSGSTLATSPCWTLPSALIPSTFLVEETWCKKSLSGSSHVQWSWAWCCLHARTKLTWTAEQLQWYSTKPELMQTTAGAVFGVSLICGSGKEPTHNGTVTVVVTAAFFSLWSVRFYLWATHITWLALHRVY